MTYPQYKAVAQLDDDGFFVTMTMADLSPLEADNGVYLMPKNTVNADEPLLKDGFVAKWQDGAWQYLPDYRGKTAYRTDDGMPVLVEKVGELGDEFTFSKPFEGAVWNGEKWLADRHKTAEFKARHQDEIWEAIKQKRHAITRGGVYVPSVKKWFHTDDSSRTQYLALQILPQLPSDLMWKTMDNSFVKLTKPLLTELAMTILQAEQADFANAERHRAKMLQAGNPLEYDYSDGWTAIYEQGATNE